jgi:hypothetical protein
MNLQNIATEAYQVYGATEAAAGRVANAKDAQAAARTAVEDRLRAEAQAAAAARAAGQTATTPMADEVREIGLRRVGQAAHESLTEAGKRLFQKKGKGQITFSDMLGPVIVPLGEGQVTTFEKCDAQRMDLVDQTRYANVRAVQDESTTFRNGVFNESIVVLVPRQCDIETAVKNGWLL